MGDVGVANGSRLLALAGVGLAMGSTFCLLTGAGLALGSTFCARVGGDWVSARVDARGGADAGGSLSEKRLFWRIGVSGRRLAGGVGWHVEGGGGRGLKGLVGGASGCKLCDVHCMGLVGGPGLVRAVSPAGVGVGDMSEWQDGGRRRYGGTRGGCLLAVSTR